VPLHFDLAVFFFFFSRDRSREALNLFFLTRPDTFGAPVANMSGEAWLYLFAVLINAVNLFLQVFFTIMYSDLEWLVKQPPISYSRVRCRYARLPCGSALRLLSILRMRRVTGDGILFAN
jgi:hypothetical protein